MCKQITMYKHYCWCCTCNYYCNGLYESLETHRVLMWTRCCNKIGSCQKESNFSLGQHNYTSKHNQLLSSRIIMIALHYRVNEQLKSQKKQYAKLVILQHYIYNHIIINYYYALCGFLLREISRQENTLRDLISENTRLQQLVIIN